VDAIAKAPDGGPVTPVGPADTVRIVTNDFMFTGGDGYTAFAAGTDVLQPGDGLLEIAVDFITANSPITPLIGATCVAPVPCRITNGS
jgi:2',3'-cyclic-nucleotide 2'-phosphodiesterase (5'-nucleotidase family)